MNLTEELTQALFEHEAETGNKPSKLRIHENLWRELECEAAKVGIYDLTEKEETPTLKFRGASVTLVKSNEDPMGFLRWSIQ